MTAICNNIDLSPYIGQGYSLNLKPQYGASVTTLDGKDHTVKIRDRVELTIPFIPLTFEKLSEILSLFPNTGAYVTWTYEDPVTAAARTITAKYQARTAKLQVAYQNGVEYYSGLVIQLTEQ